MTSPELASNTSRIAKLASVFIHPINRATWWLGSIVVVAASLSFAYAIDPIGMTAWWNDDSIVDMPNDLLVTVFFTPSLVLLTFNRLRDRAYSIRVALSLAVAQGACAALPLGADTLQSRVVYGCYIALMVWMIVECGFRPSKRTADA